jgi:hypothetical protein
MTRKNKALYTWSLVIPIELNPVSFLQLQNYGFILDCLECYWINRSSITIIKIFHKMAQWVSAIPINSWPTKLCHWISLLGIWLLTPVILATQEAEIRRIVVWGQPGQRVDKTLSWKNPSPKRAGGVAPGVGPEFKTQYRKKKGINFGSVKHNNPKPSMGYGTLEGRKIDG